jgi:hypothetical protein
MIVLLQFFLFGDLLWLYFIFAVKNVARHEVQFYIILKLKWGLCRAGSLTVWEQQIIAV